MHDDAGAAVGAEAEFGGRVREARIAKKWTQRQLAEVLGVDASAVSRLEQGVRAVRLGEAAAIADALGANLDGLVYGKGTERQLQTLSVAVLHLLDETRWRAAELGDSLAAVARMLTDSPNLMASAAASRLTSKELGDTPPRDIVEYLESLKVLVQKRVSSPQAMQSSPMSNDEVALKISEIIEAAIHGVVPVGREGKAER